MSEDGFNGTLDPTAPIILHPGAMVIEVPVPAAGMWAIAVQTKVESQEGGMQFPMQFVVNLPEGTSKLSFAAIMQLVPDPEPEVEEPAWLPDEPDRDWDDYREGM